MRRKTARRRAVRVGLLLTNVIILAVIMVFVLQNPHTSGSSSKASAITGSSAPETAANPLDQLSSADIALTVARMSSLPETTAVTNQAESQSADLTIATTDDNVITKPQVVTTALKSRADIQTYTTVAGDNVASVAAKFGVTSDSVRWSNGMSGDGVAVGTRLLIPPVNGIVYTVKSGDSADSLAAKYHASKDQIIAYNDGEISGLQPGEQILIPNATETVAAPSPYSYGSGGSVGFPWGSGPMYGYNGYDFGYCTWYVATQINVPGNWGNASSWAYYARLSGWNVSKTPTVGSIAQTALAAGGEGHVAVVDGVNGALVHIRDMNNYGDGGGWDRVGSGWVPVGEFQNYIAH